MEFEWDGRKRRANLEKHGLDFIDAELVFLGEHLTVASSYSREERWLTVGRLDQRAVAVVWTLRAGAIRIISFQRVRHEERRAFGALHE